MRYFLLTAFLFLSEVAHGTSVCLGSDVSEELGHLVKVTVEDFGGDGEFTFKLETQKKINGSELDSAFLVMLDDDSPALIAGLNIDFEEEVATVDIISTDTIESQITLQYGGHCGFRITKLVARNET
ncbi:hypothetical protein OPS25_08705 [Alteromonas ponticola]|uniref:Uncharacterized protein n=1 Tax=Alteromonas aquimaris TaxID=2998417 RepID=A0ABT3P766_9ALTE|nr:hypothetical protein [Alteromonas aquimaris]MCW8108574.1 hypothetical protein [Alteromonas aquimaris]